MATHSSVLAWRIPGMGEPGGLPSWGHTESDQLKQLSSMRISAAWRERMVPSQRQEGFLQKVMGYVS